MSVIHTKDKNRPFKLIFEASGKEVVAHVFAKRGDGATGVTPMPYPAFTKMYFGKSTVFTAPSSILVVEKIPGEDGVFEFLGSAGLSAESQGPHFRDHSYFELLVRDGKLTPWRNRYFFETENVAGDARTRNLWRESFDEVKVASMLVPFVEKNLSSYPMEVMSAFAPTFLGDRKVTKTYDFAKDEGAIDLHKDFFWKVQGKSTVKVAANAVATVPVQLVWQKTGQVCSKDIQLKAVCDSGYIPVRLVKFDDGQATLQFHALGLPAGFRSDIHFLAHDRVNVGTVSLQIG